MRKGLLIRPASAGDWESVAAIHAESWRSAYWGIYPDTFLDCAVFEERRAYWLGFLGACKPVDAVFVAEAPEPVGFVCIRRRFDPAGPLLDNLHVLPGRKGEGIGSGLFRQAASWLVERDSSAALQLLVWERNLAARGYYGSLGGCEAERVRCPIPGGGTGIEIRVRWDKAADLLRRLDARD